MNNKGWIRIAEAFVSILIIVGATLLVVRGGISENDVSENIYNIQISILKEIELNESLRSEILSTSGTVEWNNFPAQTKSRIISNIPGELDCVAKICLPESVCLLEGESEKDIYAHSVLISSTLTNHNPKILKLFCNY